MKKKHSVPFAAASNLATGLAILGLIFPLAPMAAAQAATSPTAVSRELLATLSGLLDPAAFDVDELGLELAFEDAEVIADWVSEHIAYETYPGLLRGPQGTLVAKAGNALDQSVLLAKLLGDAGYDARVALGSVGDEDAARLVASMFAPRHRSGPTFDLDDLTEALGPEAEPLEAAFAAVMSTELTETAIYQEAMAETERLLSVLGAPRDPDATAELRAEAQAYAWVEYRLGPEEPWEAAHPAFGGAPDPVAVATEYLESEVPTELTHRLRIEVSIERKRGDTFEIEPIMTPWERPVANLVGVGIEVGNTVMGDVYGRTVDEMRASMAEAAFFAPVLNGALAPGAQAFDLNGNLVPPDVAADAMAGVFQAVGEALGGAAGVLGTLGSDEEAEVPFALTAQYVDFVLVAPGGAEQRFRRTIFDRRDPAAREDGANGLLPEATVLDRVLTLQTVMVATGATSTDYVIAGMIEQARAELDVIDRLAAVDAGSDELDRGAALFEAASGLSTRDHLQLFAAFDALEVAGDPLVYRAEPTVVSLFGTLALGADGVSVSGVDIVSNARRVLRSTEDAVLREFPGAVFAGVWDTLVEREFLSSRVPDVVDSVPEPGALARFESYEALSTSGTAVPPAAAAALQRDLAAGYVVALPSTPQDTGPGWSYWRVDAETGEALGIGSSGRGVTMAEYLANLQVGLIVSGFLSVPSFMSCAASGAAWTCYCDVATSAVLLPLGLAYLGALAGATGVIFTLLDIAVVGPVTTLYTPPVCSTFASREREEVLTTAKAAACWAI